MHPRVIQFEGPDVDPARRLDLLRLQRIIMKLHPVLPGHLQVREEIGGARTVRGKNSLQYPGNRSLAKILSGLLSVRVKIVAGCTRRLPFHLSCDFIKEPIREAESAISERHVQLLLLRE